MTGKSLTTISGGKKVQTLQEMQAEAAAERKQLFEAGRKAGREEATHARPWRFMALLFAATLFGGIIGATAAIRVYASGMYTASAVIGRVGQPQQAPDPSIFDVEEDGSRTPRDGRADQGWEKQRGQWKQGD